MAKKSFNTDSDRVRKAQILQGVLEQPNFQELMNHLIDTRYEEVRGKFNMPDLDKPRKQQKQPK